MTSRRGPGSGTPRWLYGLFMMDALLALAPPLHWAVTKDVAVLGLPSAVFYFGGVAVFICASLVAAYLVEDAVGSFDP
jgi:hypothetical protein